MEFAENKNIFLQIGDWVMDEIIKENFKSGDRIPSVRELAEEMVVNRNTVNKTFTMLNEQGILENRRGMGYFVADDAKDIIIAIRKKLFFSEQLPNIIAISKQLKLTEKDLEPFLQQLRQNSDENK
jgi:GntR family transcriptional regulator